MKRKQFVVIGLGVFGNTVAKYLDENGYDVLAIDTAEELVDGISEHVTKAVVANATKIEDLEDLGVRDFDTAIVGIGSGLESAMLTVLNLKELGVKQIIAKAKSTQAELILYKIGADIVIRPEKEIGEKLARSLVPNKLISSLDIGGGTTVAEISVPTEWIGHSLKELNVRQKYKVNVIGTRKTGGSWNLYIDPDYKIQKDDDFLICGDSDTIQKFEQ